MQDKNNGRLSVTELIADKSFVDYCLQTNSDNVAFWENWLENNSHQTQTVSEAKEIVLLLVDRPSDGEVIAERYRLMQSIGYIKIPELRKKTTIYKWAVAAALFLVVGAASFYALGDKRFESQPIAVHNLIKQLVPAGKKMHLSLSDGTVVDLAAGSSLIYEPSFADSIRRVDLNGDARFAVAHRPDKPFLIQTGKLAIKVLGTTFNVQAFDSDRYTRIVLFEGKVQVNNEFDNYTITPGQALVFDKEKQSFALTDFDVEEESARLDGLLVFEEASYEEVGQRLAHKYGIVYEPNSKIDISFSGKIAHESLEEVLEKLNFTTNYTFYITSNTLKIKNK